MWILDLAITPEQHTLPTQRGSSEERNGFLMSVEIEGKVSSGVGYAGQSPGISIDTSVLMDLLNGSKTTAARRDYVSLSRARASPSSCNVKEAVMAAIRKLKTIPSGLTRYPGEDRNVHLLLLTSQLDDGNRFTPGSLSRRLVLWARGEMDSSGWCVLLSTSGPWPNSKDSQGGKIPITVEEIASMLRTGTYLGEARTSSPIYAVREIRESSSWSVKPNTSASSRMKNGTSPSTIPWPELTRPVVEAFGETRTATGN
ncbi:hypothetical protein B9Z19DRAFT_1142634 [Tuber borchii]|uniref:Uncharacterized protein n=1 Tax=Tuber borchii TaxID=42251 RepID=A0A2T7A6Q8_TUBBO|nr:hypothetical protein B9Z19DRAFT_1142634 [Tuber borchii]